MFCTPEGLVQPAGLFEPVPPAEVVVAGVVGVGGDGDGDGDGAVGVAGIGGLEGGTVVVGAGGVPIG